MQSPNLCIHFQRGFCSYGSNCRFLHQQVDAFSRGGGSFSGARWTLTRGRGGHGSRQYSYSQENYFQVSRSTRTSAQPRTPTREWSAPTDGDDTAQNRNAFKFRFMSWNILAAELAYTHAAELYPQAHHTVLDWHRRLAAVVRDVAAKLPDVLCLQEVDDWPGLHKELAALGYDGVHLQRTGGRSDGCATLWLRDRLRLAGRTKFRSAAEASAAESGSGVESGVHRIRMAEYGLKDNVALLVHLIPHRGRDESGGSQGTRAGASESAYEAASSVSHDEEFSRDSGGDESSSSMDEGSIEEELQPPERHIGQRPKRTRQSLESGSEMAGTSSGQRTGSGRQDVSSPLGRGTDTDQSSSRLPRHLRRGIWVANTHVLFNTKRGDVKLGQLRVILSELTARVCAGERAGVKVEAEGSAQPQETVPEGPSIPVIFAGDFNCSPGSCLYRFLRIGALRLAEEDRRSMSGQVEGYGYEQLQWDTMAGRPPRLVRWGPGPELRNLQEQPGVSLVGGSAAGKSHGSAIAMQSSGTRYIPVSGLSEDGRQMRWTQQPNDQQQRQGWQQQEQPFASNGRSCSVRWGEEELVYAMGHVAVAQAIAAVKEAAPPESVSAGGGTAAPIPGSHDDGGNRGDRFYQNAQVSNRFIAGGHRGSVPWRKQADVAEAHWLAVTEAAVLRHPLRFCSAYAAMDEQEREPLFTTLHARYVGTVDFVWYTPGSADADCSGGKNDVEAKNVDDSAAEVQRRCSGFRLTPLRVLHPPDPLSYPHGMPCEDWPSDHVSLVVDFRLS